MMLQDDRMKYEMGKEVKDPMQEAINNLINLGATKKILMFYKVQKWIHLNLETS